MKSDGLSDGDVARDGEVVRLSMLLADANAIRADLVGDAMAHETKLTIAEKREQVAKAYGEAAVRKLAEAGAKSAEYKAAYAEAAGERFIEGREDRFIEGYFESLLTGKTPEQIDELQQGTARSEAAYDHMCLADAEAWKTGQPVNDNRSISAPQFARDGRPMSSLTDQQRAYEEMCMRDAEAWRR